MAGRNPHGGTNTISNCLLFVFYHYRLIIVSRFFVGIYIIKRKSMQTEMLFDTETNFSSYLFTHYIQLERYTRHYQ